MMSHFSLRWRHNDHAGVSNHQPPGCLLNRLFRRKSKKTSKLRVTGLCAGNSPGTGEFSAQMASYEENVSILWRHHVKINSRKVHDVITHLGQKELIDVHCVLTFLCVSVQTIFKVSYAIIDFETYFFPQTTSFKVLRLCRVQYWFKTCCFWVKCGPPEHSPPAWPFITPTTPMWLRIQHHVHVLRRLVTK